MSERAHYYILENGQPKGVAMDEYIAFLSKKKAEGDDGDKWRRVAFDNPRDGVRVSTVFLMIDHQFGGGPPLLYETMIFGGAHDQEQWRYSTRDAALAGHARAVELATRADAADDEREREP